MVSDTDARGNPGDHAALKGVQERYSSSQHPWHDVELPRYGQQAYTNDQQLEHGDIASTGPQDYRDTASYSPGAFKSRGYETVNPDDPPNHAPHATEHPKASRLGQSVRQFWMSGWVVEFSACLLAILAALVMALTLMLYDGQPLPRWPLGITLNALIAIYSIILKTGLSVPLAEGMHQTRRRRTHWQRHFSPFTKCVQFHLSSFQVLIRIANPRH